MPSMFSNICVCAYNYAFMYDVYIQCITVDVCRLRGSILITKA
jgi:hypothetical protein